MSFITNLALGICTVTYGGVDLGKTKDFVDVTIKLNTLAKKDVLPFGDTPVEHYDTGTEIEVVVPLVEYTLANISVALPKGTLGSDRVTVGGWENNDNVLPSAKLILTPTDINPNADLPMVIYQAVVTGLGEITWDYNLKILEITFVGQIDSTRDVGDQLFRIGGPAS